MGQANSAAEEKYAAAALYAARQRRWVLRQRRSRRLANVVAEFGGCEHFRVWSDPRAVGDVAALGTPLLRAPAEVVSAYHAQVAQDGDPPWASAIPPRVFDAAGWAAHR